MELFLDNDIVLKLSSLKLLNKIESLFRTPPRSIFVLPTARPYIKNNKKIRNYYGEETCEEALSSISLYQKIPDEYIDSDKLINLSEIPNIDTGELLLFSVKPSTSEFLILTGDKRSIIALSKSDDNVEEKEFLKNNIVTFESILLLLLEKLDFPDFLKIVKKSNFSYDKTMKICFNQLNPNIENVKECLSSYIVDLQRQAPNLY